MKRILCALSLLTLALSVRASGPRSEPGLSTAGAPYAPMDVSKHLHDAYVPLSNSQRDELLSEFKGMVNLGLRTVSYEKWNAKEMADCDTPGTGVSVAWTHRCEIITGQGNGYYYFYPNESRQASTLQELDIRLHASDEKLLDDFRRPVQQLFGRGSFVDNPTVKAKAASPVRRWNTNSDVVELFMDRSVRPEGSVRFVWKRSPLVSAAQASLPAVRQER